MQQSSVISGAIFVAFIIFITLRGELSTYLNLLRGVKGVVDTGEAFSEPNLFGSLEDFINGDYEKGAAGFSDYFSKVIGKESGGNTNAQSATSSASGLFGFTDGTAQSLADKYGLGTINKNDPATQYQLMGLLTKENADGLTGYLGRPPTEDELYLAHFAGLGGAQKLLTANQQAAAAGVLPKAAASNPSIFFDKNGNSRTIADVRGVLGRGF